VKGDGNVHIKEVSKRLNTTARAIRFYEEKGLITPRKEAHNDYRTFDKPTLWRLQTILSLREIGMSITEIKKLLDITNGEMSIKQYLNVQRSALFSQWLEIKDMIETIDKMMDRSQDEKYSINDIFSLSQHLKSLKSMRKGWEDRWNFNEQAEKYDQNIKTTGYRFNVHQDYEKALNQVISYIKPEIGELGLDIGTGTGNLAAKFLNKGIKMIGVDQSEKMLRVCSEKHPHIETRSGHFLALPLMDGQVNFIVSSYALHHIPDEEKLLALEEMGRVLTRNGRICIVDLMFVDYNHRQQLFKHYNQIGNYEAIEAIEDEFYADRSMVIKWLKNHNYKVDAIQFNDILSLVYAEKI
jgi:putative AdoMet-dependent methyltransferase